MTETFKYRVNREDIEAVLGYRVVCPSCDTYTVIDDPESTDFCCEGCETYIGIDNE